MPKIYETEVKLSTFIKIEADSTEEAERILSGVVTNMSHIILVEHATDKEIKEINVGDDMLISEEFHIHAIGNTEEVDQEL